MSRDGLYGWFVESARKHPDLPALVIGGEEISYARLDGAAAHVSGLIVRLLGGRVPARVGLLASRDVATYAGYLAILRMGAAVVPIGSDLPRERFRAIARAASLEAVVVDRGAGGGAAFLEEAGVPVVEVDGDEVRSVCARAAESAEVGAGARPGGPRDLAYCLFTSGSTGRPKGVPIANARLDEFLEHNIARYGAGPGARFSQTFDLTFDPSVFDLFVAWGSGAAVVVPDRDDLYDPVSFVNRTRVTHWYSVPSVISICQELGTLRRGAMNGLRWSLFAGEQLTLEQAHVWSAAAPGSRVENLYGPTELTVTVTAYRLPRERSAWPETANGTVPIGTPYPHMETAVMDERGQRADDGELCVRGPQRFDGYIDPRDNAGRFWHADGDRAGAEEDDRRPPRDSWYRTGDRVSYEGAELVHRGRLDHQVKVRGRRLELQEAEAVLRRHPAVRDAVVVPVADDPIDVHLAAVYTGEGAPPQELLEQMSVYLPDYMLPRRLVRVDRLPLNGNGKVDRGACARAVSRTRG